MDNINKRKTHQDVEQCAPEDCASCDSDCSSRLDLNSKVVGIPMDDGGTLYCKNVLRFPMAGREYMAVIPLKTPPVLDIYLFRVSDDQLRLENIDDEVEYDQAAEAFGIAMDQQENS